MVVLWERIEGGDRNGRQHYDNSDPHRRLLGLPHCIPHSIIAKGRVIERVEVSVADLKRWIEKGELQCPLCDRWVHVTVGADVKQRPNAKIITESCEASILIDLHRMDWKELPPNA